VSSHMSRKVSSVSSSERSIPPSDSRLLDEVVYNQDDGQPRTPVNEHLYRAERVMYGGVFSVSVI